MGQTDMQRDDELLIASVPAEAEQTAAERALEIALELRSAFVGEAAAPGCACALVPPQSHDHVYIATRERVIEWVRRWPNALTVTDDFRGIRSDSRMRPREDSALALFSVEPTHLPQLGPVGRWVCPDGVVARCEAGLLREVPEDAIDVAELVRWSPTAARRVLVTADAWMGKTHLAHLLERALRAEGIAVHATWLERRVPVWPHAFLDDEGAGPRVWLVDGVDEALHQRRHFEQPLSSGDSAELLTIAFTRRDDSLAEVKRAFEPHAVFDLLPLTMPQLVALCGGERSAAEGVAAVAQDIVGNRPTALAPAELLQIHEHADSASSLVKLRADLVRERCVAARVDEAPLAHPEASFRAAKRLGAAVMFSGVHEILFGHARHGFAAADVVDEELWEAARALERSRVLVSSDGVSRFAASHLSEDLAALAVADACSETLDAAGLRNLFSDGYGVRPDLSRVWAAVGDLVDVPDEVRGHVERVADADGLRLYERLDEAAREAPEHPIAGPGAAILRALGTESVHARVSAVVGDRTAGEAPLYLALRCALENGWMELAPDALRRASDPSLSARLRTKAAWVAIAAVLSGRDDGLLDALAALANRLEAELPPAATDSASEEQPWSSDLVDAAEDLVDGEIDRDPRADLLEAVLELLLQKGRRTSLDVARALPSSSFRGPHRYGLLYHIRRTLSLDEAREVLDALESPSVAVPAHVVRALGLRASELLLDALPSPLPPDDAERLASITRHLDSRLWRRLDEILGVRPDVRRSLFVRADDLDGRPVHLAPTPEDLQWLTEHAQTIDQPLPGYVVSEAVRLVLDLEATSADVTAVARAELPVPDLELRLEEARERRARWREEREAWKKDRAAARGPTLRIENWVEEYEPESTTASERLRRLSAAMFGHWRNLVGDFYSLSPDHQRRVVGWLRDALTEALPTSFPRTNRIPAAVSFEASAFVCAATFDDPQGWLDEEMIARWLRTALRGSIQGREELLERCFAVAPAATIRAVIEGLEHSAVTLGFGETHHIPWAVRSAPAFRRALVGLLRRLAARPEGDSTSALPRLLAGLLETGASDVRRSAAELVSELSAAAGEELRIELTGVWFSHFPEDARDDFVALCSSPDRAAALLSRTAEHRWAIRSSLQDWSVETQVALLVAGISAFPEQDWSEPQVGAMDARKIAVDLLQTLAWHCVWHHEEPDYADAIATLRGVPHFARQLDDLARRTEVIAVVEPARAPPTPRQVGRLLQGSLRLVRDPHDLALILRKALQTPPWDHRQFRLLERDDGEGRRPERDLQYVISLQLDAWQRSLPTAPQVHQEPLEAGASRPDFIVARTQPNLVVPIEVKWADPGRLGSLRSDLEQQLVVRYLVERERSHGILFVADPEPMGAHARRQRVQEWVDEVNHKRTVTVHLVYQACPEGLAKHRGRASVRESRSKKPPQTDPQS